METKFLGFIKNGVQYITGFIPDNFPLRKCKYNNTSSGLSATNGQEAIDEVNRSLDLFSTYKLDVWETYIGSSGFSLSDGEVIGGRTFNLTKPIIFIFTVSDGNLVNFYLIRRGSSVFNVISLINQDSSVTLTASGHALTFTNSHSGNIRMAIYF